MAIEIEQTRTANTTRADFQRGFVDLMPLWLGAAPFGVAYALAAQTAGLNAAQTMAMSLLVFAGASQLTAAGLFASGAGGFSIVFTTLVINLRHLLLTASIAAALRHLSLFRRAGIAFGVTDESYAVSVRRLLAGEAGAALLFGANVSMYVCWNLSTIAGLLLGGVLPDPASLGLELVFPLSFLVLLMPYLTGRPAWAAAIVAGVVAIAGRLLLPGGWYILLAAIAGSLVGAWLEER